MISHSIILSILEPFVNFMNSASVIWEGEYKSVTVNYQDYKRSSFILKRAQVREIQFTAMMLFLLICEPLSERSSRWTAANISVAGNWRRDKTEMFDGSF